MYPEKKNPMVYRVKIALITTLALVWSVSICPAAITQITPSVSISEEYTDNYNKTEDNTEEEFNTRYELGLTAEYLEKKYQILFNYRPAYVDYDDHDENDSWEHNLDLTGDFSLSRRTDLTLSESFSRSIQVNQRTGSWEETDTNNVSAGLTHQFGKRDETGVDFTYSFNRYEDPNADEHESYNPSAFLSYWFSVKYGFDSSVSYDRTEFDQSDRKEDTWSGDIRLIRKLTKHFQVYLKYAHSYSDDETEVHEVYNPSAGLDWDLSKTSTVSMGAGVLFNRYEFQEDSEDLFVDIDAFKTFDFTRRSSLTISASSGYEESGADAASLGFTTYYRAGFNYNYALAKRADLDITGSVIRDEFSEEQSDRIDHTFDLGAGVNWTPLRWMTLNMSYSYTNFQTDASQRDDYEENRVTLKVTLSPYHPRRIKPGDKREAVETRIFDR